MIADINEYELATSLEVDNLLSDLHLDLMQENIREQIMNPSKVNYLNVIMEKYNLLKDHFIDNEEVRDAVENTFRNLMSFVLENISEAFNLDLEVDDAQDDIYTMTDMIYIYFIINHKENAINFFYKYIMDNKKSIIDQYDTAIKKKDVSTVYYKKATKVKEDAVIMANLINILKDIKDLDVPTQDFIEYADDGSYESEYISRLVNTGIITGSFVEKYLDNIFLNDTLYDELQVDVKLLLADRLL